MRKTLTITFAILMVLALAACATTNTAAPLAKRQDLPVAQANIPLMGDAQKAYMRSHITCQNPPEPPAVKPKPAVEEKPAVIEEEKPAKPVKKKASKKRITEKKSVQKNGIEYGPDYDNLCPEQKRIRMFLLNQ